jgi:hypothetical protein
MKSTKPAEADYTQLRNAYYSCAFPAQLLSRMGYTWVSFRCKSTFVDITALSMEMMMVAEGVRH